jgi:PAS domain S-box-containing protein
MVTKAATTSKPSMQALTWLERPEQSSQSPMQLALAYITQDGRFQYVTLLFQKQTGYTEEELLGTHSRNLVHPDDRETVRKKEIENSITQLPHPYRYRCIKKNGDFMWALEKVTIFAEYRERPAVVAGFIDIAGSEEALLEFDNTSGVSDTRRKIR